MARMKLGHGRSISVALILLVAACGGPPAAPVPPTPPTPPTAPSPPADLAAQNVKGPADVDAAAPAAAPPGPAQLTAKALPLPGATAPVSVDYLAIDRARGRVWVPVGDTGSVDVLDIAANTFARVEGFKTGEREIRGKKRLVGPSAAYMGDGYAFIGNRATSEVCPVDVKSLKLGKCLKLTAASDGVAYVAQTKEVWVTTPRDHSLTVLDASK